MTRLRTFSRSALTVLLFAVFAIGGMALSVAVFPFSGNRRIGHAAVRGVWRLLIAVTEWTGLISVDSGDLKKCKGRIIVANHPSLIDVVLLTALIPDVYSIAKNGLKNNPFIGYIVRNIMIPNDESVLEKAKEVLDIGGNVLIFPEGTRTPLAGGPLALHRGAAQLAIRVGVPIMPVRISLSRRILAKRQSILDMGGETVRYRLSSLAEIPPLPKSATCNRSAAVKMTADIKKALFPD